MGWRRWIGGVGLEVLGWKCWIGSVGLEVLDWKPCIGCIGSSTLEAFTTRPTRSVIRVFSHWIELLDRHA